jgi:hypothetical protein
MARGSQPDLFATESQPNLFGAEAPPAYRPNPDQVRAALQNSWRGTGGAKIPLGAGAIFALSHHFPSVDAFSARGRSLSVAIHVRDGAGAAEDGLSCVLLG